MLKFKDDFFDASGVYDSELAKSQSAINAENAAALQAIPNTYRSAASQDEIDAAQASATEEKLRDMMAVKYTVDDFTVRVGKAYTFDVGSEIDVITNKKTCAIARMYVRPGDVIYYKPILSVIDTQLSCRMIEADKDNIVTSTTLLSSGGYKQVEDATMRVYFNFGYVTADNRNATEAMASRFIVYLEHNAQRLRDEITAAELGSYGIANAIAKSNQITNFSYTPLATLPNQSGGTPRDQEAGQTYKGLPYSSVISLDNYIGINVSFYTFATALKNPRSVLYTRICTAANARTYYGLACSGFANYVFSLPLPLKKTAFLRDYSRIHKRASAYGVQIGDMLIRVDGNGGGHTALVTKISKDTYGRIKTLDISEATPTNARVNRAVTFTAFLTDWIGEGYDVYYYDDVDCVGYEPLSFVQGYPDETVEDIVPPDIMPEYGDKACVETGKTVRINVINARAYTAIKIYKKTTGSYTLIDTKNTIEDFEMSFGNDDYGTYKFELTDGTNSSVSYLIVADVHNCTYQNGIITFSPHYATPVGVTGYNAAGNSVWTHEFTAEEKTAGTMDISSLVIGSEYVKILFMTEYGSAVWYSYDLGMEAPFNG